MKPAYIDFEYKPLKSRNDLVACVVLVDGTSHEYFLHQQDDIKIELVAKIKYLNESGYFFVSFAAQAEAECFIDLGLNPTDYKWVCLRVTGISHAHSSSDFSRWANQPKGRHNLTFEDREGSSEKSELRRKSRGSTNLVSYTQYFMGVKRDAKQKDDMVNLILSKNEYSAEEKRKILDYCYDDVAVLPELASALFCLNAPLFSAAGGVPSEYLHTLVEQGHFLACLATITRNGLPLDMDLLKKIEDAAPSIYEAAIESANSKYPFFVKHYDTAQDKEIDKFRWVEKSAAFISFLDTCYPELVDAWPRTPSGSLCRDVETLKIYARIPELAALRDSKKTMTSLRAFTAKGISTKHLRDFIDCDTGRQHPYFGAYGTITSRNAASATSFILAQASWARSLLRPPVGKSLISADFSSQEVWIAACFFEDDALLQAATSGDVYMSFGKACGMIPEDGTKETHSAQRNICKSIILGKQFGLGVKKLALQIGCDVKQAKAYSSQYNETFADFVSGQRQYIAEHEFRGASKLADGFMLLDNCAYKDTDNYNEGDHFSLTTGNFPIQGTGAVILRRAVSSLLSRGVKILATLHDEIIVECDDADVPETMSTMRKYMLEACSSVFPHKPLCGIGFSVVKNIEVYAEDKGIPAFRSFGKQLGLEIITEDESGQKIIARVVRCSTAGSPCAVTQAPAPYKKEESNSE